VRDREIPSRISEVSRRRMWGGWGGWGARVKDYSI